MDDGWTRRPVLHLRSCVLGPGPCVFCSASCVFRSLGPGRSRDSGGAGADLALGPSACPWLVAAARGWPLGLDRRLGRWLSFYYAMFASLVQSVDIRLPQEPVRPLPKLVEDPSFQQGVDLVLTGVERFGRFFERAEHSTHFYHSRSGLRRRPGARDTIPLDRVAVRRPPCRFFGDLIARL